MFAWFRRKKPSPDAGKPPYAGDGLAGVAPPVPGEALPASAGRIRVVGERGYRVEMDLSTQVLSLSLPTPVETVDPVATLGRLAQRREGFVSAAALAQKAKQFDDGLYAAVDLASQDRLKAPLLRRMASAIADGGAVANDGGEAANVILGAARLGGVDVPVQPELEQALQRAVDEFLGDPLRSKPLGFYTWSEALSRVFRQDRMLQSELSGRAGIQALLRVLETDEPARSAYETYLTLIAGLTNRLSPDTPDLRSHVGAAAAPAKGVYFFPPSRSHETDLMKRLFGGRSIPDGFDLMKELIRLIRTGGLDLRPRDDSGWYDYQTWALESLVRPEATPEAARLRFDDDYVKHLKELFKGVLALTRETHVKQLELPAEGSPMRVERQVVEPPIVIRPELGLEPLATHYLRRAEAYEFVRGVLERAFGRDGLARMRRQTADGPVELNLDEELRHATALFRGAASAANRQVGLAAEESRDEAVLRAWAARSDDPDLGRDVRMMLPVFFDSERKKTKVWVFLGWVARSLTVGFHTPPEFRVLDKAGRDAGRRVRVEFSPEWHALAEPVFAEVYVSRLLDREEFRAHCGRYRSVEAILAHLQ